jgi:hypothetical protein
MQYINERCRLVAGKTVNAAVGVRVPDNQGRQVNYKRGDLEYDVKFGFLTKVRLVGACYLSVQVT